MSEPDADLLDSLLKRAQERAADRLERQMHEAESLKANEEESSQRRLEEMWLREHGRQRAIAESQAEQRRQEQMLVRYVLVAAAIFIVIIIVLVTVLNLSGGETAPESLLPLLTPYV